MSFILLRIGGTLRTNGGVLFHFFEQFLNAAFQLRIATRENGGGILPNFDIWIDAVAFNNVSACFVVCRGKRHRNGTAVGKRPASRYADDASPTALSDQFAESGLTEVVRDDVAVARARFIEQADHFRVRRNRRIGRRRFANASIPGPENLLIQSHNNPRRNVAAAVAALVDNEPFFAALRVVPLDELVSAVRAHVGNVNIAESSVARFRNASLTIENKIQVTKVRFVVNRFIGGLPGSFFVSVFAQCQFDAIFFVLEQTIRIVVARQFDAVDRKDIISLGRVHADFRQRRAIFRLFVLTFVNPGDLIQILFAIESKARAGKPDDRTLRHDVIAPFDVCMTDVQLADHFRQNIRQVGTVRHIGQKRTILRSNRVPIDPVHILNVKIVAETSPDFFKNLVPFLVGLQIAVKISGVKRLRIARRSADVV